MPRPATLLLLFAFGMPAQTIPAPPFVISTEAGRDPANSLPRWEDLRGIAVDSSGTLYLADATRHVVFRFPPGGPVSLFAGTGAPGFGGDGGPATQAQLRSPYGLAVSATGSVYIADLGNARVRRVNPDGRIATVAGGGGKSVFPGLSATEIGLQAPRNVALDWSGNLYISDFADHRVLQVAPDGRLIGIAGSGQLGPAAPDTVSASLATFAFPAGLFALPDGSILVADSGNHVIRRLSGGTLQTLRSPPGSINLPTAVAADSAGNLYVVSAGYDQLQWIAANGATSQSLTGTVSPRDICIDLAGALYLASSDTLRRIISGNVTALEQTGPVRFGGDNGVAAQALLNGPRDIKPDGLGGWLVADTANHRIRRISPAGVITTIAGNGESGSQGDGGPATSAALNSPQAVAVDAAGSVYIADTGNHRIRRILANGIIQTVAGTGTAGLTGEVGNAMDAQLSSPTGLAFEPGGALLICDTGNHRIRRLDNGVLLTIAGAAEPGFTGERIPAYSATLRSPRNILRSPAGDIFFTETGNRRIRRISPQFLISTVAEGLDSPWGLALDSAYSLYFTDTGRHQVRRITPAGIIETLAGSTRGFAGDGGAALDAQLDRPSGMAIAADRSIWLTDTGNHRIRKLSPKPPPVAPAAPPVLLPTPPTTPPAAPTTPTPVDPPDVEPAPALRVTNAASLLATVLAPGLLVNIEGTAIGPAAPQGAQLTAAGVLETTLGGVQVRIDGIPTPLLYAQKDLLQVQVPYRLPLSGSVPVEVLRNGQTVQRTTAAVARVAPGVFVVPGTGGQIAATQEDGTANGQSTPAAAGATLSFRVTGEGKLDPAMEEGRFADAPYPKPLAPVAVTIGQERAEIVALAAASLSPGVLQITIRVPSGIAAGQHRLIVSVDGTPSQSGAGIWVK